jgi:hypothetical protein
VPGLIAGSILAGIGLFELVRPTSKLPLFGLAPHLPYKVFSPSHLLDLFNEQVLVALPGWLGLGLGWAGGQRRGPDPHLSLLAVAGVVPMGMWCVVNPALGSLDWDLMAMPAPAWVALGVHFFNARQPDRAGWGHQGVVLVALSLFHTLPWIALQRDEAGAVRAIEAMAARDAHTYGRRSGVLGVILLMEGHREAGKRQLERADSLGLKEDAVVLRSLCQLYLEEGRYQEAGERLERALRLLPDRATLRVLRYYRERAPQGRERSAAMLERVLRTQAHPTYFGLLAEFYKEEGKEAELIRLTRYLDETIAGTELLAQARPSGALLMRLGGLYLRRGRVQESRRTLEQAAALPLRPDQRQGLEELLEVVAELEGARP